LHYQKHLNIVLELVIILHLKKRYSATYLSLEYLFLLFIFLSKAATIVHGGLTHLFNDYADFLWDMDAKSPAILSGVSRVIQKKLIQPENGVEMNYHPRETISCNIYSV